MNEPAEAYRLWCRDNGKPDIVVYPGIRRTRDGRRLDASGFIYAPRGRKPVARALFVQRQGGQVLVLSMKRDQPIATFESLRWQLLTRQAALYARRVAVVEELTALIRKTKAKAIYACDRSGLLYKVQAEVSTWTEHAVKLSPVSLEKMTPLARLAAHTTVADHDHLVGQLVVLDGRLKYAWNRIGRIESFLAGLLGELTRKVVGYKRHADNLYFTINGRRYPACLGVTHPATELRWPRPTDRDVDVADVGHDNTSLYR